MPMRFSPGRVQRADLRPAARHACGPPMQSVAQTAGDARMVTRRRLKKRCGSKNTNVMRVRLVTSAPISARRRVHPRVDGGLLQRSRRPRRALSALPLAASWPLRSWVRSWRKRASRRARPSRPRWLSRSDRRLKDVLLHLLREVAPTSTSPAPSSSAGWRYLRRS